MNNGMAWRIDRRVAGGVCNHGRWGGHGRGGHEETAGHMVRTIEEWE